MGKNKYDGTLKYISFVKIASNTILMGKFNSDCPDCDGKIIIDSIYIYIYLYIYIYIYTYNMSK